MDVGNRVRLYRSWLGAGDDFNPVCSLGDGAKEMTNSPTNRTDGVKSRQIQAFTSKEKFVAMTGWNRKGKTMTDRTDEVRKVAKELHYAITELTRDDAFVVPYEERIAMIADTIASQVQRAVAEKDAELAQLKHAVKVAEGALKSYVDEACSGSCSDGCCSYEHLFKKAKSALSTIQKCMKGEA